MGNIELDNNGNYRLILMKGEKSSDTNEHLTSFLKN
jgi:hypothetical protein